MIAGTGIDIIEVERVADKIGKDAGFKEMIFSAGEIAYCEPKTNKHQYYAARFAAKEAFFKALGTGWLEGTQFNEIEIVHDVQGKPCIALLGNTLKIVAGLGIVNILVSLSHIKEMACAIVIIEK